METPVYRTEGRPLQAPHLLAGPVKQRVVEIQRQSPRPYLAHRQQAHRGLARVERPHPGTNKAVVGVMGPTGGRVHDLDHRPNRVTGGHEHPGTRQLAE